MDCPKCGSPMEIISQIRTKEEGKEETRTPTVYRCMCCNYHTEPMDYKM